MVFGRGYESKDARLSSLQDQLLSAAKTADKGTPLSVDYLLATTDYSNFVRVVKDYQGMLELDATGDALETLE